MKRQAAARRPRGPLPAGAQARLAVAALLAAVMAAALPALARAAAPAATAAPATPAPPYATDPAACRIVRLSDVGWTDITATTAVFANLVARLGYEPRTTVLSAPVTFASMQHGDIDVFLGNWMPAMAADRRPYDQDGSVQVVRANLVGAKYTLAVPDYAYEAGLHDFRDIARFAGALGNQVYGIEPGNSGNSMVMRMIRRNQFGLGAFHVVESSEQGMLSQVERAVRERRPIVFLAWDPHPMNLRFRLRYLTGGDDTFGPDYGSATVYTTTRAGYGRECPNIARLLANLEFTVRGESEVMADILDHGAQPDAAAGAWIDAHPQAVAAWLQGVATLDGRPAPAIVQRRAHGEAARSFEDMVRARKIPVGDAVARGIEYVKRHGTGFFDAISTGIGASVGAVRALLGALPSPLLMGLMVALAWWLRRSMALAVFVLAALLFIMNQGYWQATIETLSLVLVAACLATLIGVPVGIAAAHRPRLYHALRPVLDLMQTLPTFVYLIPTLVLFGLGVVPGLISTVIFSLPAPIRLTQLGISSVPPALREAAESFGATRAQLLFKVELPCAAPTIIAGITQCIMLSLSMVVIAALVGAGGLGVPVVRALNTVQVGMGFEAGFAIVLLAIILDRMTHRRERAGS